MKQLFMYGVTVCLVILVGCGKQPTVNQPEKTIRISPVEQEILNANNSLGFDLLRQLSGANGENTIISPVSISMALGMTLNGAAGATYDSMQSVLGFQGLSREEINQSYRHLLDQLFTLDPDVLMEIANSIWIRDEFRVKESFQNINHTNFDAEIRLLDFSMPSAVDIINGWIAAKTHDRISDVIDQIRADVAMYLINAIYFNGTWTYKFDQSKTQDDLFSSGDGKTMTVDMMRQSNNYQYFSSDQIQVVDLPYGDGKYSMTIVLPASGYSLGDLIRSLNPEQWNTIIHSLHEQEGTLYLPRFEVSYKTILNSALRSLGMGIAFSDNADFSGITDSVGLCINQVIHQTFFHVDEAGTEAAAVTVVEIRFTSAGDDEHFYMIINRPFLFALRERSSGAILFLGTVYQPERIKN